MVTWSWHVLSYLNILIVELRQTTQILGQDNYRLRCYWTLFADKREEVTEELKENGENLFHFSSNIIKTSKNQKTKLHGF
jgi:hypothetical protein